MTGLLLRSGRVLLYSDGCCAFSSVEVVDMLAGPQNQAEREIISLSSASFSLDCEVIPRRRTQMRTYFVLIGLLLLTTGLALAQGEFLKCEAAPAFMFIR